MVDYIVVETNTKPQQRDTLLRRHVVSAVLTPASHCSLLMFTVGTGITGYLPMTYWHHVSETRMIKASTLCLMDHLFMCSSSCLYSLSVIVFFNVFVQL